MHLNTLVDLDHDSLIEWGRLLDEIKSLLIGNCKKKEEKKN